jgi:tRNA wybutosine-synthesizing protein 4
VTFVDIDYEKLMATKMNVIHQTKELRDVLGAVEMLPEESTVLMRSTHYIGIGCDLKNLNKLEEALKTEMWSPQASILCIAEVSLTYMDVKSADALISWISKLGKGQNTTFNASS